MEERASAKPAVPRDTAGGHPGAVLATPSPLRWGSRVGRRRFEGCQVSLLQAGCEPEIQPRPSWAFTDHWMEVNLTPMS